MDRPHLNPQISLTPLKDNYFRNQFQSTKEAFFQAPATMRMIEVQTGILRPNICRYVRTMSNSGIIQVVRIGLCPETRHRAGFYSTNPDLFIPSPQLQLKFDGGSSNG